MFSRPRAETMHTDKAARTMGRQRLFLHHPTTGMKNERIKGVTTMRAGNWSEISHSSFVVFKCIKHIFITIYLQFYCLYYSGIVISSSSNVPYLLKIIIMTERVMPVVATPTTMAVSMRTEGSGFIISAA
jgi:hypothetical protein